MSGETEGQTLPYVRRGAGPDCECGHHRSRCLIGHAHVWSVFYRDGRLVRTPETFHCHRCGAVCTADEARR